MMKKVKDHKHLYRTDTGAIVNTDTTGPPTLLSSVKLSRLSPDVLVPREICK